MAGLFGAPRRLPNVDARAMGIMPGDQPAVGDFPMVPPMANQPQQKPYQDTLAGKLAMAGQILTSRGRSNPMLQYRLQQQALEQQMRARQQLEMQQRQWGNEDWLARERWERANPAPRYNDTVADYEFIVGKLGDEAGNTYLRNRADPPQYRQGPDGQFYRVEVPQAPTAPVGRLTPIEPMAAAGGNFMTPAQFQAIVAAKGQAAATEWARRNNIQIRN